MRFVESADYPTFILNTIGNASMEQSEQADHVARNAEKKMKTEIFHGEALTILKSLPDQSVQMCVTSPPYYGLRDYGVDDQLGLESTPDEYVKKLVAIFSEVRRVLRNDGTLWINLGDSYNGSGKGQYKDGERDPKKNKTNGMKVPPSRFETLKQKDLIGIPWRVAFALQADGWYLRQDIIWHKPNAMPESVRDRCGKSHEYIFLLSKSKRYFFDYLAIKEKAAQNRWGGKKAMNVRNSKDADNVFAGLSRERDMMPETRNKRSVWTIPTKPYKGAHFAVFPVALVEPCVLAGSKEGDTILDPFFGSGTTGVVARKYNRGCIGIELNSKYIQLATQRISSPD